MKVCVECAWEETGRVVFDQGNKIKFPTLPSVPGIYRMVFTETNRTSVYIGETEHNTIGPLARTQQTNIRLNERITSALARSDSATLTVVTHASLVLDDKPADLDLTQKMSRRLVENAALVAATAGIVEAVENL